MRICCRLISTWDPNGTQDFKRTHCCCHLDSAGALVGFSRSREFWSGDRGRTRKGGSFGHAHPPVGKAAPACLIAAANVSVVSPTLPQRIVFGLVQALDFVAVEALVTDL